MILPARDPRHGLNGYSNLGCRCDLCRDAAADRQADYARLRSMREPCPGCGGYKDFRARQCRACDDRERRAACGTERSRRNGCRCDRCREAASAARNARRHRRRVPCSVCGAPGCLDPRDKGPAGAPFPRCRPCQRAAMREPAS